MRVSQEETKKYRNRIQRRIFETLKILKVSEISDTPMNVCDILKWQNLRLDRVVAEYLLQKGFSKSGYKVITLQGFEVSFNNIIKNINV